MNNRIPAIISTVSNSFCDFTLDIAVNKYNTYLILLGTAIGSLVIQLIYGGFSGFLITYDSIIYIAIKGLSLLLGYIMYILALKRIPVTLTALIESGSLFAFLAIDYFLGYLKINTWFIFLFITFISSVILFSLDTYKFKNDIKNKKIKMSGILILLVSMFFYGLDPYLIKLASANGANEVTINIGYYVFAIPFFIFMYIKNKKNGTKETNKPNNKIIIYILLISIFEAIYLLFGTMGYINEAAVVNAVIQEIRIFLLFILSTIAGTDKLTLKKTIAIIMGSLSIIGIYLY